ncbi:MAG: N-acetyltransferase [Armatimonadota bacterium]
MPIKVTDRGDRYEIYADDLLVGFADVVDQGNSVILPHVEVFPEHGGKGYATILVRDMLRDLKEKGRPFVPHCPFVIAYLVKHPDEA